MSAYTLDDIRAAAEKKYASTDITVGDTTVTLVNVLRLPKEKRDVFTSLQEEMDSEDKDEDVDQAAKLADLLRLVAKNEKDADVLLDAIGDDLALLATIFEMYAKGTESGEA
jgi:hypothetical protein